MPVRISGQLYGVNLAGAEFGGQGDRLSVDYTYPEAQEIDYFAAKNFGLIRLPFMARRLIQGTGFDRKFNPVDIDALTKLVDHISSHGMKVLLDMHDYGLDRHGHALGLSEEATGTFSGDWALIARHFRDRPNVIFGLMNEPHHQPPSAWADAANEAIVAIRYEGAGQPIFVAGGQWGNAERWRETGNAQAMLKVRDPLDNIVFEVHQYLCEDRSGRHATVTSGLGRVVLTEFTEWARRNGKRGFLGEFAFPDSLSGYSEGRQLLNHVAVNSDVWAGWAYWAAGPWWGEYMFTLEPRGGVDRPQMMLLQEFIHSGPRRHRDPNSPSADALILRRRSIMRITVFFGA